ncbi:MAG: AAA-like domain-containing protein, partial [Candidatus Rokuibacteriota bacterium]
VILLLVSADFVASEYCYDIEMRRALERHTRGQATVIPVIVRPVTWSGAPFAKLQALPKDGKAVTTWENRDAAFLEIAEGIRRVIGELHSET